jgi:pyridoxal phosphate enzyme (YggS family)
VAPLDPDRVRANLAEARERIAGACARAGRDPGRVELLAATKYVPVEEMGALAEAGIELVGENTAQSLAEKRERWGERFTFDFIGHVQSRKVRDILPLVRLIHSVESESVLRRLERHTEQPVEVLLEVNVAGEESKSGLAPDRVDEFIEAVPAGSKVRFAGLMTMPPLVADPRDARPYFEALRTLAERLRERWAPAHRLDMLSMGTSQDYEIAAEEGATVLRLGTVLYA